MSQASTYRRACALLVKAFGRMFGVQVIIPLGYLYPELLEGEQTKGVALTHSEWERRTKAPHQ